jgi:hypothetical protein
MTFHYLSFTKLLRFSFVGTIVILIIYFFSNNISSLNTQINKVNVITSFPKDLSIKKIDVGQGEDIGFWMMMGW